MAKVKNIRKSDHPLLMQLGIITTQYLQKNDSQIIDFLDDSTKLYEQLKGNISAYEDFSFIVTPAYKALEKWIYLISPNIGIPLVEVEMVKENEKSVGTLLRDQDGLKKTFEEILSTIDAKSEIKDDLNTEIQGLKSFLKNYRHEISHCWKTLELPVDALNYQSVIIIGIRRITEKLFEVNLLS